MMDDFSKGLYAGSAIATVAWMLIASAMCSAICASWRREAVTLGLAEYSADSNGDSKWHWKTEKIHE